MVEVARYREAVGVEVATRFPELLMEVSMSVPSPESVMELVAVRPATLKLPETMASPCTERSLEGVVVPMPTDPSLVAKYAEFETESEVEEA